MGVIQAKELMILSFCLFDQNCFFAVVIVFYCILNVHRSISYVHRSLFDVPSSALLVYGNRKREKIKGLLDKQNFLFIDLFVVVYWYCQLSSLSCNMDRLRLIQCPSFVSFLFLLHFIRHPLQCTIKWKENEKTIDWLC